jgi:hypothetical protein
LVIFGVTLIAFVGVQWWLGEGATIPPRIATQRTIWSASWFAFFLSGAFFLFIYFIPIWFQAVMGVSALQSGIDNIPLILSNAVAVIASGFAISKIGYYMPFVYGSIVFTCIGSGLITTFNPTTDIGRWIGYQLLYGLGCGMGFQQPPIAAQAVLPPPDMPIGIAITLFFRNFGAALFVTAGNNVMNAELERGVSDRALPGVDAQSVLEAGATSFRTIVPEASLDEMVEIYNYALQRTFLVGLIISCLAVFGAAFMEWKTMRRPQAPPRPSPSAPENGLLENGAPTGQPGPGPAEKAESTSSGS